MTSLILASGLVRPIHPRGLGRPRPKHLSCQHEDRGEILPANADAASRRVSIWYLLLSGSDLQTACTNRICALCRREGDNGQTPAHVMRSWNLAAGSALRTDP